MRTGWVKFSMGHGPDNAQKSGWLSTIRARLYLAFGFAAALTIIGSSIAFYEFTVIGMTTNEIVSRSLPATTVSLRLAEQASSLVSSGPR
jgi:phosphoglycerate-specific signal transduction histidine kinase